AARQHAAARRLLRRGRARARGQGQGRQLQARLQGREEVMHSRSRAGFTLLELLAVIMIIAILAGVLISQLGGAENSAFSSNTKILMKMIEQIAGEYEIEHGSFPRSSFTPEQGVANDGENVGIEALVVAFYSD